MYERLYKLRSPNGLTIDKCIQPSVDSSTCSIGLVACDPECYDVRYIYRSYIVYVVRVAQRQNVSLWPAFFRCPALDL